MTILARDHPRIRVVQIFVLAASLILPASLFGQTIVYSADFESGTPVEFSSGTTSSDQIGSEALNQGLSTYLGKFTLGGSSTLTLNGLPAHNYIRLDVDVYFFNTWDGSNGSFGPDYFSLSGDMTFSETFTNHHGTEAAPQQTYPTLADVYLNSTGTALTSWGNADATFAYFSLGPTSSGTGFTVSHNSNSFSVTFGGPTSQADEQWGIDNVTVTVCDSAQACDPNAAPPPVASGPFVPVPVLGHWLLVLGLILAIGTAGFVVLRR